MRIITIDFETYYDKDYSLKKLTTEAYIRDPRYQCIGVARKIDDQPAEFSGPINPYEFLAEEDYSNDAILCHNTAFDGAILEWKHGIRPKLWLDTMSMAAPFFGATTGVSLAALARVFNLGEKDTTVLAHTMGKRREQFDLVDWVRMQAYARADADLTYELFKQLRKRVPNSELLCIDKTIRMFTQPTFVLDTPTLDRHLSDIQTKRQQLLDRLAKEITIVNSNNKLAKELERLGVDPPMKVSPRTGVPTYAFAKTDQEFLALQDHPDPEVSILVSARLGLKSSIEETRTIAFRDMAARGPLPVLLKYNGAHTGRYSGGDKINLQNLPRGGALRKALKAPKGHVVITSDLAQIEARLLAYVSGQRDLVNAFAEKRDVYSEFASDVYGKPITKADKVERFVGKTCLAEGTMVVTDKGLKPIELVSLADKLWDGVEWVDHEGLIYKGTKRTLSVFGAWLTPDHRVWSGTGWEEAQTLVNDVNIQYQTLAFAAANSPLPAICSERGAGSPRLLSDATVPKTSTLSTPTILSSSNLLGAMLVLRKQLAARGIGYTRKLCQMIHTERACLTGWHPPYPDATRKLAAHIHPTEVAVSLLVRNGEGTGQHSLNTSRLFMDGIIRLSTWIEKIMTGITSRVIYGSCLDQRTLPISDKSENLKPASENLKNVYDLANAGPRHRFFIYTDAGFVCVSNCILGLGYGVGAAKLQKTLKIGQAGITVDVSEHEAQRMVSLYRAKNYKIKALWDRCGTVLRQMAVGLEGDITDIIPLSFRGESVILPNGFPIQYPGLTAKANGFEYIRKRKPDRLYGAKMVENIIQALAAIIIKHMIVQISKRYHVALQVHDEIVCIVPEADKDAAVEYIRQVMSTPPMWAPDLPIECEIGVGYNYGEAK